MTRDQQLAAACAAEGLDPNEALQIGGQYVPLLQHGQELHISGQIPRVGSEVVVCGRVGEACSEAAAQRAARIACLRALVLLYQHLGSLDRVARIPRLNVYVQSAADFTRQSEVANGASALLYQLLGEAGVHVRTSVGVYQLPKNAAVELDMVAIAV